MEDTVKDLCEFSPAKRAKIDRVSTGDGPKMRYEISNSEHNLSKTVGEEPGICTATDEALRHTTETTNIGSRLSNTVFCNRQKRSMNAENGCCVENADQVTPPDQCEMAPDSSNAEDDSLANDDDDDDEVASTVSNISGLSDLSNVSGLEWKPITGAFSWAQKQMELGMNPRNLLQDLVPLDATIPNHLDDFTLWKIVCDILTEPPRRKKLSNINTLDDVINLLKTKEKVIVLTGAGVSVSSGIPDFRSRDGIYARLAKDLTDLPDPQAMFDIHYFRKDPRPFYKFAKEIYPGQFEPSLSHRFIKLLEKYGKLLRNYSQNIDTLEQIAGIERVIQCHGSFATATCTKCSYKVDSNAIKDDIFKQNIPKCPKCESNADSSDTLSVMKPDIVFFGEGLPDEFHSTMAQDKDECDLLIVIGSSLKVRPVALIPFSVPIDVPQILINREPLKHITFDVELLGDCDVIINEICLRLGSGWQEIARNEKLNQISEFNVETIRKAPQDEKITSSEDLRSLHNVESDEVACEEHVDIYRTNNISCNVSAKIPAGSYVFSPPSCYLFSGAEIAAEQQQTADTKPTLLQSSDCVSRSSLLSAEFDQTDASASGEDSGVGDLRDNNRFDDDQHLL